MEGKQATQKDSISDHQAIEINDDEWIKELTTKLNKCHPRRQFQKRCTIFKVPEDIRKCDKEGAYDPVVVAIGPYHHGLANDSTVPAMQDFKWDCVRRLLSRRTKSSSEATALFRSCLLKMKEMDDQVRECYSEDLHHLSPHDLAMIMLLDGCFIIHLLLNYNIERNFRLTKMIDLKKEESMAEAQEIVEAKEESMAEAKGIFEEKEESNIAEALDIVKEREKNMTEGQEMVELDKGEEKFTDGRLEGIKRINIILVYDLLKLENQIPFFIVCELFDILKASKDKEIDLVQIVCDFLQPFMLLKQGSEPPANVAECLWIITPTAHIRAAMGVLSGAARAAMTAVSWAAKAALAPIGAACKGAFVEAAHSRASRSNLWRLYQAVHFRRASQAAGVKQGSHPRIPSLDKTEIHHLLHLFHSRLKPTVTYDDAMDLVWIPTASELQLAGIKFEENKEAKSFLDISFKNNGTIRIPQLQLGDHANTVFKNLIAFEQCSADPSKYITSYTFFMDNIISTSRDVHLLELEGILVNLLSTDDAAASFFNGLNEKIVANASEMYLMGLHREVKNYYNSPYHKHRARLIRDYFSSPWAILSLLAAVVLLLFTAEQSFFSVYSYFRPPHA
ncbi:hypothetical protein IHE45_15G058100 [Dioscorea alata]|uniref:Uncharacterized protein n=1 Tax=Dioscorea alata TaxID=55571 RepID=A0ACB7ULS0_DIOAL|nr:hypothetical protein IHE45_15G058100 [Dioscorea alata]